VSVERETSTLLLRRRSFDASIVDGDRSVVSSQP
jgi:hypothetical protein